jgi:hypothetical protein
MFRTLYGAPEDQQLRDNQKREACRISNINLLEIPFWWDNRKESIAATIVSKFPQFEEFLLKDFLGSTPIPESHPSIGNKVIDPKH